MLTLAAATYVTSDQSTLSLLSVFVVMVFFLGLIAGILFGRR